MNPTRPNLPHLPKNPTGADLLAEYRRLEAAQDAGDVEPGVTTEWIARLNRDEFRALMAELDESPTVGRR